MNKFLGLGFGLVRADTSRSNSFDQAKLAMAIAAMLALTTTCADAAKRVARAPIHVAAEPSYWMYQRCSSAARAADPNTVCFPSDPDANVRFQLRRDYFKDSFPSNSGN
jgi:hypothetical protein